MMTRAAPARRLIAQLYPARGSIDRLRPIMPRATCTRYRAFPEVIEAGRGLASASTATLFRNCAIRGRGLRETLR